MQAIKVALTLDMELDMQRFVKPDARTFTALVTGAIILAAARPLAIQPSSPID